MAQRKKKFSCGHCGRGVTCRRCAEANRLEAIVAGTLKPAQVGKGRRAGRTEAFAGWTGEKFAEEAKKLRAVKGREPPEAP